MIKKITSLSNPIIKNVLNLQKSNERKNQDLIVIEGFRESNLAISAGYSIITLFFCKDFLSENDLAIILKPLKKQPEIIELNKEVFNKLAYRNDSGGLILIAKPLHLKLDQLNLSERPLIIIIEAVEKPGNLGAILRTADAAHVDAVIICDSQTDIYNPNVIRSSIGCLFTNHVVSCSSDDAIKWLMKNNINIYTTSLTASKYYHTIDFKQPAAIVMGSEAFGVTDKWLNYCNEQIKIPMKGKIDSINVSTATAIILFEALRQRGFSF
jgi:RNA methyltransferase, TrmH family